MKKLIFIPIFALLLALCACGESYSFTLIDENGVSETEMKKGGHVSGLIYTREGDVFFSDNYKLAQPLYGVIADGIDATVMDAYELAREAVDSGERLLMIYIDGLGWQRFEEAAEAGDIPYLASLDARRAASVYPTITPVNYAAMTTGQPPKVNGVTKRGIHKISCGSIFSYAAEKGLTSFISEGNIQILDFPGAEQELNPDLNGDGTGDDEIFDCAMQELSGSWDIVFVHFHSVDDASHDSGPWSENARQALIRADQWCRELAGDWQGKVIITADHGQHDNDGSGDPAYAGRGGTHGDFAPSDIFIPILTN